nr:hypothetical protein [Tanacetum cinerariifolium]
MWLPSRGNITRNVTLVALIHKVTTFWDLTPSHIMEMKEKGSGVIEQATDEKLGRTVTRVALQCVFRHLRRHYEPYSQDFTHMELVDGGDRRTSGNPMTLYGT